MERPSLRIVEGADMDKHRALEAALAQIDRNFGKGSIMRLGANDRIMDVEAISTGSLGLDTARRYAQSSRAAMSPFCLMMRSAKTRAAST